MVDYTILVTDADLNVLGDPITTWTSIDVTLRFNEPGSGQFVAPGDDWIRDQLQAGCRVVVIRNGVVLISGPMEDYLEEQSDDGENAGVGTVTVSFGDDLAKIVARQAYQNPALTPETQATDHWTFTGNAEDGLRQFVDTQAGPGARAERRIPHLVLGSDNGVGTSITVSADLMGPAGDLMRDMASTGGGLGFRAVQDTANQQILFQVYQPADKSNSVRFGFGLGNLKYRSYQLSAPKVTTVIVGGQGTGADRYVTARTNSAEEASWGRYESLVSARGTAADLADQGDKALADGAATTRVVASVVDTEDQRFPDDYGLGDKVAIEGRRGTDFADVVQNVHIQVYATAGEIVSAMVGSQAATTDPYWVKRLQDIDAKLNQLARSVQPA